MKCGGILVTVTPGARHLYQLRELIYNEVRLHTESAEVFDHFELEHEEKLTYPMELKGTDSLDLLQMTPFAWKATNNIKQQLVENTIFVCDTDFIIRIYRKK